MSVKDKICRTLPKVSWGLTGAMLVGVPINIFMHQLVYYYIISSDVFRILFFGVLIGSGVACGYLAGKVIKKMSSPVPEVKTLAAGQRIFAFLLRIYFGLVAAMFAGIPLGIFLHKAIVRLSIESPRTDSLEMMLLASAIGTALAGIQLSGRLVRRSQEQQGRASQRTTRGVRLNMARVYGGIIGGICVGFAIGFHIARLVFDHIIHNETAGLVYFFAAIIAVVFPSGYLFGRLFGGAKRRVWLLVLTLPLLAFSVLGIYSGIANRTVPVAVVHMTPEKVAIGWSISFSEGIGRRGLIAGGHRSIEVGYFKDADKVLKGLKVVGVWRHSPPPYETFYPGVRFKSSCFGIPLSGNAKVGIATIMEKQISDPSE